jgi:undecaprenyl-diphosphatase
VRRILFLLTALLLAPRAGAQAPAATAPAAELSVTDAVVLGVVEGVTEFLPISSTGHLIIASRVLGLESEQPLTGRDGQPLWHRKPSAKHPEGVPLTLKLAADTYTVVIQFGAIAAVALLYWPQLLAMLRGLLGRDPAGFKLLVNLLVAFVPAAAVGLLAHGWIEAHFTIGTVIVAQAAGAALMLFVERWRRRHYRVHEAGEGIEQLALHQAAGIGAMQVLALWPGMSRSMATIVGGYFAGLEPRRAAEFSFLLGFVTLTAATGYKSLQSGGAMIAVFGWPHVLLGGVVAAVTAALCVRWLVGWLTRHGLGMFAYYRLALAAVLAAMFYL